MNLVLADLQPDRLTAARQSIEALGAKAVGITVDVSDTFGKLHVAVNNVGVAMHAPRWSRSASRPPGSMSSVRNHKLNGIDSVGESTRYRSTAGWMRLDRRTAADRD